MKVNTTQIIYSSLGLLRQLKERWIYQFYHNNGNKHLPLLIQAPPVDHIYTEKLALKQEQKPRTQDTQTIINFLLRSKFTVFSLCIKYILCLTNRCALVVQLYSQIKHWRTGSGGYFMLSWLLNGVLFVQLENGLKWWIVPKKRKKGSPMQPRGGAVEKGSIEKNFKQLGNQS